jgi:hypothetical protein
MGFIKAEKREKRLKALIYGPSGSGKTTTALSFPNVAAIDGEKGTDHYAETFDFVVDSTSSVNDLVRDIDELLLNPGNIKTVVIDPITVFMDNLQLEYLKKLRLKKGPDYELQPNDHGPLKQKRKELIDKLLCLDMNIVCTAREVIEYKADGRNFMTPIGLKPEVPKEVPYMFDVLLRIEIGPDGQTRIAHCEKDRTNKLPKVFEFSYAKMVEFLGIHSLERDTDPTAGRTALDLSSGRVHEIVFRGNKTKTAGVEADTLGKILAAATQADLDEEALQKLVTDSYSVSSLFDLKNDEGLALIKVIEKL